MATGNSAMCLECQRPPYTFHRIGSPVTRKFHCAYWKLPCFLYINTQGVIHDCVTLNAGHLLLPCVVSHMAIIRMSQSFLCLRMYTYISQVMAAFRMVRVDAGGYTLFTQSGHLLSDLWLFIIRMFGLNSFSADGFIPHFCII